MTRDIYGRKPVSGSRGKTQQRIMDLQRADGTLPGAPDFRACAPGTVGAALADFLDGWVVAQPITSRRAYERTLALLARDFVEHGPGLDAAITELTLAHLRRHIEWRVASALGRPADAARWSVQLTRIADWFDERHGCVLQAGDELRAVAARIGAGS